jgi:hypothetical protein
LLGGFFGEHLYPFFCEEIIFISESAEDLTVGIHQEELFAETIFDLDGRLVVF